MITVLLIIRAGELLFTKVTREFATIRSINTCGLEACAFGTRSTVLDIPAPENIFILERHFLGKIYYKLKTYVQVFQQPYKYCDGHVDVRLSSVIVSKTSGKVANGQLGLGRKYKGWCRPGGTVS